MKDGDGNFKSLSKALTDIYDMTGALPEIVIENAALVGEENSAPGKLVNAMLDNTQLYYIKNDSGNMIELTADYGIPDDGTINQEELAKKVAAACYGSKTYDRYNLTMDKMYNALYDDQGEATRSYAYYRNLHLPTELANGKVLPITDFYISKDWIKTGDNTLGFISASKGPEYFCL